MKKILYFIAVTLTGIIFGGASPSQGNSRRWEYDRFGAAVSCKEEGQKTVHLIFTADSAFEGGDFALDVLAEKGVKGSFFFTGNFMRDTLRNRTIIRRTINEGHYVAPHGDRHILLAEWNNERTPLVTPDSALMDIENGYLELARYGIERENSLIFIPSFEWYHSSHIDIFKQIGFFPINMTPGIETYRDYTTPDLPYYTTSEWIWNQLMEREAFHGLDGSVILIHLGTDSTRTDKFYRYLPAMIDSLTDRGYILNRF